MVNRNDLHLSAMDLVETFSKSLKTLSWIWGGFTIDIYENHILRDHDDLDYLTLNLHRYFLEFAELFVNSGWEVKTLENGDLGAKREGVKVQLGHVELSDNARWAHNGEKGSIWFPVDWLDSKPVVFCGAKVHVVKPEFQYVMIEQPQMLNPCWKHREKDIAAREYLRSYVKINGLAPEVLFERVRDTEIQTS